ncbi:MAG TPA: substrate-binding domain-containing protein, partial [Candidatus Brocadiia bacterium]|nr:substrate-binding domain-containing protein [Candidatus Brocadiia bacterium]
MRTCQRTCAVITALVLLAGCKSPAPKTRVAAAATPKLKVALVLRTLQNDYFREMAETARRRQQARAADYDLEIRGARSMDDVAGQIAIVEELTRKKPDVLIVAPSDSKALIPALKSAKESGVAVVIIDSPLDPEAADAADLAAPFVGPDGQRGAKKAAEFLADAIRPGDRVAIIAGQKDSLVNKQRLQGATITLREVAIRIVAVEYANWERVQAKEAAKRLLAQHADLKGIVALNDPMALGALDA